MNKTNPRILIAAPTSIIKRYILIDWYIHIKTFTYSNLDILIVDNSLDENYHKELRWYAADYCDDEEVIVACTSGGYDPIHPGHISCILDSWVNSMDLKGDHDILTVIVNGDAFLRNKKGESFMDLKTRCQIVSAISGVDYVVPFEIENDQTVCKALEIIKPKYFWLQLIKN